MLLACTRKSLQSRYGYLHVNLCSTHTHVLSTILYHKQPTRALRAHICTPRAPCMLSAACMQLWTYTVHDLYLHIEGWCILIAVSVEGCGYNGQQKYTICDACRSCHSIRSTVRLVFRQIQQICCAYELLMCLDVEIWWFFCWQRQQQRQNRLLYPLRMRAE